MVICSFDASSLLPENLNAAESADEARTTAITTHNLGLDPPHQQLPRPSTDSRESRKSFQSSKRFSLTQFGNISLTSFPPVSTLSGSSAGCGGEIDKSESTPTLLTAPAAAAVHGHLVNLEVGEYVHILESYESHWYRGYVSTVCYSDQNRSITGVGGGGSGGTAGSLTTIKLGVFPASSVVLLKDPRFKLSKTSTSSSNLNNSPLQTCRNLKRVRTQKLFRRPTLQMKQKRNQADLDHINKFVLQSYAEQQQETTGVNSGGGVSTPYEQQDGSSSDNQPLAGEELKILPIPRVPPHATWSGFKEPLIDEIAASLREWGILLRYYTETQHYVRFYEVKTLFDSLFKGRRQLLSKTLSQEELQKLRKSLISKMEYGNRLQGIDLILRHPERGYLITQHNTSVINLARTYLKRATLVSDFRFSEYACALPEQRASMSASATLEMRKFNNEYQEDYYQGGGTSSLSNHMASSAANNMPQPNNTNSNSHSIPLHIFFELKGCAASLCLPGEYAELHFSLYNRKDSKFVTEKFVVFVNSSGHAAEELQGRSPMRTVFQDLDFSESGNDLALVCQIIRVGKMNVSEREGLGDKAGFVVSPGILLPHSLSVSSLASMQSTTTTSSNFSLYNHSTTATNRSSTNPRPKRQNFVRRPFGCAVLNLEELDESKERPTVANISNNNNLIANQLSASLMDSSAKNGEHTIRIFVPSSDNIFSSLHDHILANNTSAYETSSRAEYLEVKVSAHTSVDVLQLVKDHIQQPDTILTPRKYTSLDILPLGKRNSMYFSLINAEFSQGRKATAKNVEVSIQVRLNSGEFVENCICVTPTFPVSTYDSVVYYHNNNPKWNETICVNLDAYTFEKAHLFITYRHVSSSSVKLDKNSGRNHQNDKNEKNIAFSFLPLLRGDRTVVGDGNHTLSMYKYDAKLVVPAVYLNYPAGPRLFVYAGFDLPGDNLALATECMAKLPLINKDFIHVKTYLCSSVLTQNLALHKILRWSTLDGILKNLTDSCSSPGSSKNVNGIIAALKEFSLIGEVEIVKFLPSLLSSLFALLSSPCNSSSSSHSISETMGPLDTEILMALVFILSIVHDRRFTTHRSILDAFIEEKVGPLAPKAWLNLTVAFQKLVLDGIHEKDSGGRAKDLRNGLKMWKDVMRCCVKSWVYYKETRSQMEVEEETLDFPSLLDRVLKSINALMSQSNPPHIIATQTLAFKSFPVLVNILKSILETDRVLSIVFTFFSHCRGGILKLNGHRLVSMSGLIKSAFLTCDHGPDFNPVRYRTELVTNMVKELLEWAEGGWGLTTKAPLTPSRTQSQPSHYHLQQQQLKMLPDKENFRQWVVTISDMVDRAHRLLEEEGYIDESQYDLTFAQGGSSLYVIKSICHMLPKLLFLYNNMESCISPATFVVAAAAAVGKSETFQATTTTGKKDAYLPKSQDKSDVASIIIALFHVMPSQFVSEMLDMSETLRLNETTRPLNLLFKTFQSFLNGDEAFPPAWPALHILAHRTVLKVMGPIGESLMKTVGYVLQNPRLEYARLQVDLTSYFRTLLLLLNSNWVQVENFGPQHSRVAKEVGADIREAGGKLLEHVWSSLARMEVGSVSKSTPATTNGNAEAFTSLFTPHLIGSFMELTLSPHTELKAIAINLMFGAIEREFEKNGNLNFAEAECIDRLERLIMGDSKGNTEYRQWLIESLQAKLRQWIRRGQQDCPPPALTVDKKRMSSISSCASSADVFSSLKIGGFAQAARSFIEDVSTFLDLCIVVRSIIEPPVVLNAPETNCLKPTVSSPPASHDGQIFAILKLMRFVRTIGHRGIYVKYAHRLSNIHLGKNRPVEAALALKLHADVLDWSMDINVEPLLEYNFPRTQTAFDRKSEILQNVVLLLERGCAWERAYEVLKELSVRYERGIGINYGQLADIYQHQSSLLRKIWGQSSSEAGINNNSTRFPPTYYRVYFHGGPWPDHLRGHQFVYKAGEWERLPAFIERIMNEYPDAQLYRNNGPVDLEISNGQVKFLQITAVKPEIDLRRWFNSDGMVGWPLLWENGDARSIGDWYRSDSVTDCIEMAVPLLILEPDLETQPDGIGIKTLSYLEKMPDQIKEYLMYNEVNLFTHSRPIKRTVAPNELSDIIEGPALEFSQLWTEKTLLITSDNFPCLSDKSLVVETINYDISPIENAIISVKGKNRQLLELEKKYSSQSHQAPLNMNPFTMALTGSVDAPVNGGIPMYRIAFLNGRPKTPLVTLLERSINDQVMIIDKCLQLHEKLIPDNMIPHHLNLLKSFEHNFEKELAVLQPKRRKDSGTTTAY